MVETVVYYIEDEEVMETDDGCLDMREELSVDAEHPEIVNQEKVCPLNGTSILKENDSVADSTVS